MSIFGKIKEWLPSWSVSSRGSPRLEDYSTSFPSSDLSSSFVTTNRRALRQKARAVTPTPPSTKAILKQPLRKGNTTPSPRSSISELEEHQKATRTPLYSATRALSEEGTLFKPPSAARVFEKSEHYEQIINLSSYNSTQAIANTVANTVNFSRVTNIQYCERTVNTLIYSPGQATMSKRKKDRPDEENKSRRKKKKSSPELADDQSSKSEKKKERKMKRKREEEDLQKDQPQATLTAEEGTSKTRNKKSKKDKKKTTKNKKAKKSNDKIPYFYGHYTSEEEEENDDGGEDEDENNSSDNDEFGVYQGQRDYYPSGKSEDLSSVSDEPSDDQDGEVRQSDFEEESEGDEYEISRGERNDLLNELTRERGKQLIESMEIPNDPSIAEEQMKLFRTIGTRGCEPIISEFWATDFPTLPKALFTQETPRSTPSQSEECLPFEPLWGSEFYAIKALQEVFALGGRVRDSTLLTVSPQVAIERTIRKYMRWAMYTAGLEEMDSTIPVHAVCCQQKGEDLLKTLTRASQRLERLALRHQEAHKKLISSQHNWPVLVAFVAIGPILCLISRDTDPNTLKSSASLVEDSDIDTRIKFMTHIDLSETTQDVWNSLAVALCVCHARDTANRLTVNFTGSPYVHRLRGENDTCSINIDEDL
ncbi:uncharacterized protein N7483_010488 [Penicillium malachiteum]|uniref:uncharacterized protein n=1 Tax=Penicillium malachiteum TaxID=1324776 RepID=UPI002547B1C3|nr:uncharacterized protein N7483_010488 [Penicillium malachiteum]KAJ5713307.1 hypothetical protein N7483_010488 [Penicillium malachiteum]